MECLGVSSVQNLQALSALLSTQQDDDDDKEENSVSKVRPCCSFKRLPKYRKNSVSQDSVNVSRVKILLSQLVGAKLAYLMIV